MRRAPVPAAVECPDWCDLEHGHAYDDLGDGLSRSHSRTHWLGPIAAEVVQYETAASPSGPIDRHPVNVLLQHPMSGGQVDIVAEPPTQLRALAALLVGIAEHVESLPRD